MVRNIRDTSQIVIVGLLTGTIAHYITFILLNIGLNICYWLTGGCTDSLGGPPPSIWFMLGGAFPLSCFSLLFCGWITVPCSILIGLILQRTKNNKTTKKHKVVLKLGMINTCIMPYTLLAYKQKNEFIILHYKPV